MELDISDKSVFIGVDVHLRRYTVCCRCERIVVKRATGWIVRHKFEKHGAMGFLKSGMQNAKVGERQCLRRRMLKYQR